METGRGEPAGSKKKPREPTMSEFCSPYVYRQSEAPDSTMPLSHFVREAEKICSGTSSKLPVFSGFKSDITYPLLQEDVPNRILVFVGCFNPPHLGHLELLAHVFLRADSHTIAAMLVPARDSVSKGCVKGEAFTLTKIQRSVLLQDDLLSRFSWIYGDDHKNINHFQDTMIRLANAEGYALSFTGLAGSDHYAIGEHISNLGLGWGTGDLVTSDVTRPSCLVVASGAQPMRLRGCERWRKILPAKSNSHKGRRWCWPCWKFRVICPELAGKTLLRGKTSHRLHTGNSGTKIFADEPSNLFGGIALQILRRCHESDNSVMWICHRTDGEGVVWFISSGRQYPTDERRPAISSTLIRKALDETENPKCFHAIKDMAMNPEQLLFFVNRNLGTMLHTTTKKNSKSRTRIGVDTSTTDV
jgi:hypothetical protein